MDRMSGMVVNPCVEEAKESEWSRMGWRVDGTGQFLLHWLPPVPVGGEMKNQNVCGQASDGFALGHATDACAQERARLTEEYEQGLEHFECRKWEPDREAARWNVEFPAREYRQPDVWEKPGG